MAEAMSDSWYDDARITEAQLDAIQRDLEAPPAQRGAAFAPFVVRKLLAEVKLLREERDQARALVKQIQADRERLNAISKRLDQQNTELITALQIDAAEQRTRAETAKSELAEVRERIGKPREEWAAAYMSLDSGRTNHIGPYDRPEQVREASQRHDWPLLNRDGWAMAYRVVGEWQAAEQQPEDGDRG